ncbi:MAG: hypothetical protein H3C34_06980 [Caldilineaceae bacterium]|nr:hypothetical protein [Caldilineaceae bacterium]
MTSRLSIGKIVKSNSHVDYVCQVYNVGEVEHVPEPNDYAFGAFVVIEVDTNGGPSHRLIGIIYNTLLMNPEFGNLGPRLSPRTDVEIFSPDYLAETATLVGVFAVGWLDAQGMPRQGVPPLAATVNCPVTRLEEEELRRFHTDAAGRVQLHYAPLLLNQNNALVAPLLLTVIDRLTGLFPDRRSQLAIMRNNLAWKNIVQPAG